MRYSAYVQSLLLAFTLSAFLSKDQTGESAFVPRRCSCVEVYPVINRPLVDFLVIHKGAHCRSTEIIVQLRNKKRACLSPKGQRGKRLRRCWDRIEKSGGDKKQCLRRTGRSRARQRKGRGQAS